MSRERGSSALSRALFGGPMAVLAAVTATVIHDQVHDGHGLTVQARLSFRWPGVALYVEMATLTNGRDGGNEPIGNATLYSPSRTRSAARRNASTKHR